MWSEIQDGRFREDLYFRLHTLVIRIPPLRERLEDIPLLVSHFSAKYQRMIPQQSISWTDGALTALQSFSWPGNVRQLEAVINRALVLYTTNSLVTAEAINESLKNERHHHAPSQASLLTRVTEAGRNAFWELVRDPFRNHELTRAQLDKLIRGALQATKGSYKQAARMMGVEEKDYNRFLDFLKNSGCKPDYRLFRKEP